MALCCSVPHTSDKLWYFSFCICLNLLQILTRSDACLLSGPECVTATRLCISKSRALFNNLYHSSYFFSLPCWLHLYTCLLQNHIKSTDILVVWLVSTAQKSPYFLAEYAAFMWLLHTATQWNPLKQLPTHQIFHELGPDTSMRGKTMSETRPALAACLVCVTVILPAALPHSTSYFTDHQADPGILQCCLGLELPVCFLSLWHPVAPDSGPRKILCLFVLVCFYFYEWL